MSNTNLARKDDPILAPALYFGEALEDLELTIAANLGEGATFGIRDLDKIKMPGAGSLAWKLPGLDKPRMAEEFEGVILFKQDHRGYYEREYKGGNAAPDCWSEDTGVGSVDWNGEYGGKCAACPLSKFTKTSAGKWIPPKCKARARLFILTRDQALPVWIDVPSSSMPIVRDYFKALTKYNIPHFRVVTIFALEEATSKGSGADDGGIAYAKLKIRTLRNADGSLYKLSAAECVALQAVKQKFAAVLARTTREEYDAPDERPRARVVDAAPDEPSYQDGVSAEDLL